MIIKSKNKIKVAIVAIFFIMVTFFPYNYAKADIWGAAWLGQLMKQMMEEMAKEIHGAIMGALKQEAAQMINENVSNAISQGNGNGALFVTNWEDFLINDPQKKVELYMNDFFSNLSQGRNPGDYSSLSGLFSSASGSQKVAGASTMREGVVKGVDLSSIGGNYLNSLEQEARNMTVDVSISSCPQTDFSSMFSGDTWASTSTFFGVDTCNKFGFNNVAISAFLSETAKQQKIPEIQGPSYKGFLPSMSGDSVITPGSLIGDIQAQAEDVGNKIVASAENIPEVITSLVIKFVSKTIKEGIGEAKNSAGKNNASTNNYSQQAKNNNDPTQAFSPSY